MKFSNLILTSLFIFTACIQSPTVDAQLKDEDKDFPEIEWRNPLGITNYLSGNFGELRNNHFHSGIDIKTNQREGYRIYAVADGYVSRINVSPRGYGNALYIDHPNGYTSVYAHLQKFNDEIEEFVRAYQYEHETFQVEIRLEEGQLPISIGDTIALSGNSGVPVVHICILKLEKPLLKNLSIHFYLVSMYRQPQTFAERIVCISYQW